MINSGDFLPGKIFPGEPLLKVINYSSIKVKGVNTLIFHQPIISKTLLITTDMTLKHSTFLYKKIIR